MMSSGFYIDSGGFLTRLHPVTRILVMALAFISALIPEHPLWLLLPGMIYGLAGSRVGVFTALRRVWILLVFVGAASFLIWTFAYEGTSVVFKIGPIKATYEGMLFGAGMGLRLDLMAFCGLIFLVTTPVEEFTYGLNKMGMPFPVSFAMSLSFRLLPLFMGTVKTIMDAQMARGLEIKGGPVGKLRAYIPLLVPVFSSALRRTDQLAAALESRGFGFSKKRGHLQEFRVGLADGAIIFVMVLIIISLAFARYFGLGLIS